MSDKTQILIKRSLAGKDLSDDEAEKVADRLQLNSDAIARFEALEDQLEQVVADHEKAKKGLKWLGGFLVINYGATFRESIESVIMGAIN